MRIGELARRTGVSADTIRFYERAGWLPRPGRRDNHYREYVEADVEHLRLLLDLRRLDIPLDEAAQVAKWCHSGHCSDTRAQLPTLIAERRAEIAARVVRLRELDARLADLQGHLAAKTPKALPVLGASTACCDAAAAVLSTEEGACACCVDATQA